MSVRLNIPEVGPSVRVSIANSWTAKALHTQQALLKREPMFPKFERLPFELRRQIWYDFQDLEEARVVEVRWSKRNRRFFTDTPVPALYHICHETRRIVKEYYDTMVLTIGVTNTDPVPMMFPQSCCLFRIYFNYDRDTLYLSSNHFENGDDDREGGMPLKMREFLSALNAHKKTSQNLRALAISGDHFDVDVVGSRISNMTALEYLYFVFGDNCCPREHSGAGRPLASAHKKILNFTTVEAPKLPTVQPPPLAPPIINIPGLGPRMCGIPIHLIPGYPHFNSRPAILAKMSEEKQRAVRIDALWQQYEEELFEYLEDMIATRMEGSRGFLPREDWDELETIAVEPIRR
ncbi:hypothetical protein HYFRA_00003256 [Hymenoscyphus fraxineus]|uniref:2EXR domain-containing protein n=1 Tax=Hymenoscyphus fraxineus TaxID=746836 RepID=A0A9N9PT25_9HELO|nr:hypothetical protein HYFRA_00003256 [Hymenoscyphus fraxineus]